MLHLCNDQDVHGMIDSMINSSSPHSYLFTIEQYCSTPVTWTPVQPVWHLLRWILLHIFQVVTAGQMRVGWARPGCLPDQDLGSDDQAFVFDGFKVLFMFYAINCVSEEESCLIFLELFFVGSTLASGQWTLWTSLAGWWCGWMHDRSEWPHDDVHTQRRSSAGWLGFWGGLQGLWG